MPDSDPLRMRTSLLDDGVLERRRLPFFLARFEEPRFLFRSKASFPLALLSSFLLVAPSVAAGALSVTLKTYDPASTMLRSTDCIHHCAACAGLFSCGGAAPQPRASRRPRPPPCGPRSFAPRRIPAALEMRVAKYMCNTQIG